MTTQFLSSKDVYQDNINQMLAKWLKDRQSILVLYHQIAEYPASTEKNRIEQDALISFCQLLTDYISVGHFRIFEKLAEAQASFSNTPSLNKNLLMKILRTTISMLDFCDKYTENKGLNDFRTDFSELGESFAKRLDWEDELIQQYQRLLAAHNHRLPN